VRLGAVYDTGAGRCLVPRVWRAVSAWEKMRGLLGRPPLADGEGLLIDTCSMVHTFGMRYRLDLAFLDPQGRVCKLVAALPPARCAGSLAADATLELAPGALERLQLKVGDRLAWKEAA
jgi:uncharacterized membrane protein (UPF0127 family)